MKQIVTKLNYLRNITDIQQTFFSDFENKMTEKMLLKEDDIDDVIDPLMIFVESFDKFILNQMNELAISIISNDNIELEDMFDELSAMFTVLNGTYRRSYKHSDKNNDETPYNFDNTEYCIRELKKGDFYHTDINISANKIYHIRQGMKELDTIDVKVLGSGSVGDLFNNAISKLLSDVFFGETITYHHHFIHGFTHGDTPNESIMREGFRLGLDEKLLSHIKDTSLTFQNNYIDHINLVVKDLLMLKNNILNGDVISCSQIKYIIGEIMDRMLRLRHFSICLGLLTPKLSILKSDTIDFKRVENQIEVYTKQFQTQVNAIHILTIALKTF